MRTNPVAAKYVSNNNCCSLVDCNNSFSACSTNASSNSTRSSSKFFTTSCPFAEQVFFSELEDLLILFTESYSGAPLYSLFKDKNVYLVNSAENISRARSTKLWASSINNTDWLLCSSKNLFNDT